VGLSLAPLKVPRRAVRIIVLTVRSATARWRATLLVGHGPDRSPRTHYRGGEASVFDRSGVGFPIRHSTHENQQRKPRLNRRFCRRYDRDVRCLRDRIKNGGGVGASCMIAVSRGVSYALVLRVGPPPSRDCHRADMNSIRRAEETSVVSHQTGRVESSR